MLVHQFPFKNWKCSRNYHFHFLICLRTTFHLIIDIAQELRKLSLSFFNLFMHHLPLQKWNSFLKKSGKYYFHFLICFCTTKLKFLMKWENYHFKFPIENTSCFLGMRWFLLTFAFFQDRSLLLSYFSTSLPWLSKSTWISIGCKQFQEKKTGITFSANLMLPFFPALFPEEHPKPTPLLKK